VVAQPTSMTVAAVMVVVTAVMMMPHPDAMAAHTPARTVAPAYPTGLLSERGGCLRHVFQGRETRAGRRSFGAGNGKTRNEQCCRCQHFQGQLHCVIPFSVRVSPGVHQQRLSSHCSVAFRKRKSDCGQSNDKWGRRATLFCPTRNRSKPTHDHRDLTALPLRPRFCPRTVC
jgi:hypothetical protein